MTPASQTIASQTSTRTVLDSESPVRFRRCGHSWLREYGLRHYGESSCILVPEFAPPIPVTKWPPVSWTTSSPSSRAVSAAEASLAYPEPNPFPVLTHRAHIREHVERGNNPQRMKGSGVKGKGEVSAHYRRCVPGLPPTWGTYYGMDDDDATSPARTVTLARTLGALAALQKAAPSSRETT